MIRKITVLVIMLIVGLNSTYSQSFEGIVNYKMRYTSKSDNFPIELMQNELGRSSTLYIKDGYYKEITDSKFMSYQLFISPDDKIYFKHNKSDDTLRYSIVNIVEKDSFEYKINHSVDTIMGLVCDELIFKTSSSTKKYYYSKELSLDPKFYENYTVGHKNKVLELIQAVYLKLIIEYDEFTGIIEATEIKKRKLKKGVFSKPKHSTLVDETIL